MKFPPEQELAILCSRIGLNEHELIRVERLINTSMDWELFFKLCNHHVVIPLVYKNLRLTKYFDKVPRDISERMQSLIAANLALNMKRYSDLNEILDLFNKHKIHVLVLKGAALVQTVYRDISLRVFGDIDLLIHFDDLQDSKKIMSDLGYELLHGCYSVPDKLNEEFGCQWDYKKTPTVVEIHWNLFEKRSPFKINPDELIDRSERFKIESRDAFTLGPEDSLIYLCIHQYKHHWTCFRDLCDVNEFTRTYSEKINWLDVLNRSDEINSDKCLYYTFSLAKHFLDTPIPEFVLSNLRERVKPSIIDHSIFNLIEKNIFTYNTPHGFWPVILVNGLKAKKKVVQETMQGKLPVDDSGASEELVTASRNRFKILQVLHSFFFYRKLTTQLGFILARNIYARVSGLIYFYKKS